MPPDGNRAVTGKRAGVLHRKAARDRHVVVEHRVAAERGRAVHRQVAGHLGGIERGLSADGEVAGGVRRVRRPRGVGRHQDLLAGRDLARGVGHLQPHEERTAARGLERLDERLVLGTVNGRAHVAQLHVEEPGLVEVHGDGPRPERRAAGRLRIQAEGNRLGPRGQHVALRVAQHALVGDRRVDGGRAHGDRRRKDDDQFLHG